MNAFASGGGAAAVGLTPKGASSSSRRARQRHFRRALQSPDLDEPPLQSGQIQVLDIKIDEGRHAFRKAAIGVQECRPHFGLGSVHGGGVRNAPMDH